MNFNNFTIKSQDAVQRASEIAEGSNHQAIETGHILKGVFETAENISNFLLKKLNVNQNHLNSVLDQIIKSYPKVSGGNTYLSSNSHTALQQATKLSGKEGDKFVSVESIIRGILKGNDDVAKMMKDSGITEKEFKLASALNSQDIQPEI